MIIYLLGEHDSSSCEGGNFPVINGFSSCSENLAERWLALGKRVTVQTSVGVTAADIAEIQDADLKSTADMVETAERKAFPQ